MRKKPPPAAKSRPPIVKSGLSSQPAQAHPPQKKEPRANAMTHGLTAKTLLPSVLKATRLLELKAALREELQPQTFLEELLVHEAARHFAFLEIAEEAEPAVLRHTAITLAPMAAGADATTTHDLMLFAAVNAEALERVAKYRRCHERAAYLALEWLENIQTVKTAVQAAVTNGFTTKADCESYLQRRFSSSDWSCPHCQHRDGHWLLTRKRWECAACGAQIGLRHGTVFENSPLPLTTWFCAIGAFAANSTLSVNSLAELTGIARPATARAMLGRLRDALHDEDPASRFAGLLSQPNDRELKHNSAKRKKRPSA